jgi:hypothetical protein
MKNSMLNPQEYLTYIDHCLNLFRWIDAQSQHGRKGESGRLNTKLDSNSVNCYCNVNLSDVSYKTVSVVFKDF